MGWGTRGLGGAGTSPLVTGPTLPFRDSSVQGVVLARAKRPGPDASPLEGRSGFGHGLLAETARVLVPGGRVVVIGEHGRAGERPLLPGLTTILDTAEALVLQQPAVVARPKLARWGGVQEK